jgi:hypothetical protein
MNIEKLSTYFVGATVVDHQAVNRVQAYEDVICASFGKESKKPHERHITVIPPFKATYVQASAVNLGGALATILSTHPTNTTIFSIQGLDVMGFEGEEFLHFPVSAHSTAEMWTDYVQRIRRKVLEAGIELRGPIPEEYRAHITVFGGKNLSKDATVKRILKKSRSEPALYFRVVYLTVYTKYPHGWDTLTYDPNPA